MRVQSGHRLQVLGESAPQTKTKCNDFTAFLHDDPSDDLNQTIGLYTFLAFIRNSFGHGGLSVRPGEIFIFSLIGWVQHLATVFGYFGSLLWKHIGNGN